MCGCGPCRRKLSCTCAVQTVAAMGRKPPVSPFDRHMMSGTTAGAIAGKHRSAAAKAGEHFVGDQQHVVFVQSARMRCRNSTGCTIIPPAPCSSGSTISAAISP